MSVRFSLESIPDILQPPLLHAWERLSQASGWIGLHDALPAARMRELPLVLAASEFAVSSLIQDPQALVWVSEHDIFAAADRAQSSYEQRVGAARTIPEAQQLLREWRRRALLRIAWRDIVGATDVRTTLQELSDLAQSCVRASVECARTLLATSFGTPRAADGEPSSPIVLGMGKLGGAELNFSSDIDLVFLFSDAGETSGPRVLDNEEYFARLVREVIRLLDARTENGIVFRVDVRLRPFGESGPLVVSLAALEDYLQQHGRDWERYAWIKARALVGAEAYQSAQDFVRPFVYRRYLDFGVFDSLREMKALIEREVARRELEDDLKLGRGGIRELEFIVQSLQLVRGGSDRRLQTPSLLDVLPLLGDSKLLSTAELEALRAAYTVLRKSENAVQMIRDEQTHRLPVDPIDRARLCLCLGVEDWPAAHARIEAARATVARQFEALVFGGRGARVADDSEGITWLDSEAISVSEELAALGMPQPARAAVAASLEVYRQAPPYRRLDEVGRRRVHVILARLLKAAATRPEPALVVQRVLGVLDAIGARASYLALLREQTIALDRLIEVCAVSGFLARQFADYPLLLDELLDAKALEDLPTRAAFERELAARIERLPGDDPERLVEALRQFQKAAVFSVALADVTGRLPLMRVSDRLTDIAELILRCCMDLAWAQMTRIHGVPYCADGATGERAVRVAVAGYGKLGGLELGYGSDLDLVFLHDSPDELALTQGEKPVNHGVFFLRLGQRIVHLLTMHSAAGRLYEVDMRLRPNGKGGFLMTGIDGFERYQLGEAWTWEHQALLRARAVAGDAALGARFEAVRRHVLTTAVRRARLRTDVLEMRKRMRRELSTAGRGEFDIKQDAGGLADIEFLVQYLVLAAAADYPELLTYSDNVRQLEGLARTGVLDASSAEWLKEAYIGYRSVLHHQSLEGGPRVVGADTYAATRARVQSIWHEILETDPR